MSIGKKFTAAVLAVMFVMAVLSVYLFYRFELREETGKLELIGRMTGQLIEESLNQYMLNRDVDTLNKGITDLARSTEAISRIWLINDEGVIKAGTEPGLVGTKMAFTDQRCRRCHESGRRGILMRKEMTFRWVQPVRNKPQCQGCHSPGAEYNGVIILDFPLAEINKHVKTEIIGGSAIILASIVLIGFVILSLSKTMLIGRLNNVVERIGKFREGNYQMRMPLDGNDEITRLEDGFNRMAEAINARDIDRKRAEEERKNLILDLQVTLGQVSRSQKIWQETFDGMGDLISVHDTEFNIIKVNRAFAEYFRLDPKDIINKKCYEIFHVSDSPSVSCPQATTLKENRPVTAELQDAKTNKIFLVSTFPFHFHDMEFHGIIHVAKDITEEREKEMRLIMSERLASLGQMASGIAHEINNPLAAIAGCTERLHDRVKKGNIEPGMFDKYLGIIEEEIVRCKNIITDMLSFVRKTTYTYREVSINTAIGKALEIIGFQGRLKNVTVLKKYRQDMPPVHGSEGDLRQCLLALITNALDAMEDRGTLTVETGSGENIVFIKIGDTGRGISPRDVSRIFDPFFTTKSDKGGTGLGLSIANKIIASHNGSITVSSEEGKGTVFTISLPA